MLEKLKGLLHTARKRRLPEVCSIPSGSHFLPLSLSLLKRFHMSMMEIYNEAVYDLLGADVKDARQSPTIGTAKTSLDIRQNAAGGTSVPGLTEVRTRAIQTRCI